jgi:hypothetical protein
VSAEQPTAELGHRNGTVPLEVGPAKALRERPELLLGAAFMGGLLLAFWLKRRR